MITKKVSGERDGAEQRHQRDEAMPQHDLEARFVDMEERIETAFEQPIEPSVLLALRLEQVGAHHRRERARDHQ
jgi:hypothetical protein